MTSGRKKILDLTGEVYHYLTVIKEAPRAKKYIRRWSCRCKCGNEITVNQKDLRSKNTKSCGCYDTEVLLERSITHGFARGKSKTSEYNTWRQMKSRCQVLGSSGYEKYGARGIKVCKRWNVFENFIADMGKKPFKHYSLDRIDNNKGYSSSNCRWANSKKQANNTRNNLTSEEKYLKLLKNILENGEKRSDRTGVGTVSIFSPPKIDFYLDAGFPLITTKKMAWKNMVDELVWFLSGSTNVYDLPEKTQKWWTPWANKDGSLGEIYGSLWRKWPYGDIMIDQIQEVINSIKDDPMSRRHIISTWHPGELDKQKLPPCHGLTIQFYVDVDKELSCFVHQRSADCFIGLPVNLASYSLFLTLIAQVCGLKPYRLSYSIGDAHIYLNHIEQVKKQLSRDPFESPRLKLNSGLKNIDDFSVEDVSVVGYKSHGAIKAPLAV